MEPVTDPTPDPAPITASGPLAGLIVTDLSRVVAGPMVGMILGDLGAIVTKVERPGAGDDTRQWGPPWLEHRDGTRTAAYFTAVNRNKQAVAADYATEAGARAVRELVAGSDVVIENFRPGTLDRYGLGYEDLAAGRTGLIWASVTGFGTSGAAAELPGYDLLAQASSGLMSVTGDPAGPPMKVGVAVVDEVAALWTTIGILAALDHRHRTGLGQRVEVSLFGAALATLLNQGSAHLVAGEDPQRGGNDHPSIAPYTTYRTSDVDIVVAAVNDAQFAGVLGVVGLDGSTGADLTGDPRFATNADRVANRRALDAALAERLLSRSAAQWVAEFTTAGIPSCQVRTVAGGFALAAELGLDAVTTTVETDGTVIRTAASPLGFSATPLGPATAPPRRPR